MLRVLWSTVQTKPMFFLVVFALGSMAIASLLNPAQNIVANIASPSTLQTSIGSFAGNVLFLQGVWLFRRYLMNRNWRLTFIWTTVVLSLNCGFQLLVIYNAWGIGQTGWFYAFGNNVLQLIQGVAQILSSLAVVEVSPVGYEASVYEFLTTIHNAGITLNSNLQNVFVPIFHLNGINKDSYNLEQDDDNKNMAAATYFTMVANVAGALIFCWFFPRSKRQCKEWLDDEKWKRPVVGVAVVAMGGSALVFSLVVSMLSVFPATNCLQIAGGPGC